MGTGIEVTAGLVTVMATVGMLGLGVMLAGRGEHVGRAKCGKTEGTLGEVVVLLIVKHWIRLTLSLVTLGGGAAILHTVNWESIVPHHDGAASAPAAGGLPVGSHAGTGGMQTTTKPSQRVGATIVTPQNGASISGRKGVLVTGRATGLPPGTRLWLLDRTRGRGTTSYLDGHFFVTRGGGWRFLDAPIGGGPQDVGAGFRLTLVMGGRRCAVGMARLPVNRNGDVPVPQLPSGCRDADRRDVVVTRWG